MLNSNESSLRVESSCAITANAKSLNPKAKNTDGPRLRSIMSLPSENKGKFRESYKVGHIIARSTIGTLRKCLHLQSKQIRLAEFISKRVISSCTIANFLDGLDKICELEHPNIANSFEVYQDSRRYYIVME